MTSGMSDTTTNDFVEPWRQRTERRRLEAAERRIRDRVEVLYDASRFMVSGRERRRMVRRCLVEAEGLCELAETAMHKGWRGR